MASNIIISDLLVTPGIGHIALQWSYTDPNFPGGLSYRQLDAVEVWASLTNDRDDAEKVAEGRNSALHMALVEGQVWYYWIRARDKEGEFGDWYPSSATAGVLATVGYASSLALSGLVNCKMIVANTNNDGTIIIGSGTKTRLLAFLLTLSNNLPSETDKGTIAFSGGDASGDTLSWDNIVSDITENLEHTITNGSTMGVASGGIPFRLWWAILRAANGALHLGVINCSNDVQTDLTDGYNHLHVVGIPSEAIPLTSGQVDSDSTIVTGTADTAGKFYIQQNPATDGYPYQFRLIGYTDFEDGLAVPGTWDVLPTTIRSVTLATHRPGAEVQRVVVHKTKQLNDGMLATPFDDTIPQSDEGEDFLIVPITPHSKLNWLDIECAYNVSLSAAGTVTVSLFEGDGEDAIAAQSVTIANADDIVQMTLRHFARPYAAGSCSYRFRAAGTSGTITVNGVSSSRKLGGVMKAFGSIKEIVG